MSAEILYPASKKVTIAGKEIEIKKLPFKKYIIIMKLASSLNFDKPEEMESSAIKVVELLSIAIEGEKQWLEALSTEDIFRLVKDVLEVNKVPLEKPKDPAAGPESQ